jgi:hypothetical protein
MPRRTSKGEILTRKRMNPRSASGRTRDTAVSNAVVFGCRRKAAAFGPDFADWVQQSKGDLASAASPRPRSVPV